MGVLYSPTPNVPTSRVTWFILKMFGLLLWLWKHTIIFFAPHMNTSGLFALRKHIFVKNETFPLGLCLRERSCQLSRRVSATSHFHFIYCCSCGLWRSCCKVYWKIDSFTYYYVSRFPPCIVSWCFEDRLHSVKEGATWVVWAHKPAASQTTIISENI